MKKGTPSWLSRTTMQQIVTTISMGRKADEPAGNTAQAVIDIVKEALDRESPRYKPKPKGYRDISVGTKHYYYAVSRGGTVRIVDAEDGKSWAVDGHTISGMTPNEFERAIWKGNPGVLPSMVAAWAKRVQAGKELPPHEASEP